MEQRGQPPEFRHTVLDFVEAGRLVAEVAHDLGVSDQSIYTWRRQERIDRDLEPRLISVATLTSIGTLGDGRHLTTLGEACRVGTVYAEVKMNTADIANLARIPAEKAVLIEYGAPLEPELRVSLGNVRCGDQRQLVQFSQGGWAVRDRQDTSASPAIP